MTRLLPSSTFRRSDRLLAIAAIALPAIAGLAVALGAPSPARFVLMGVAILYGPATPALRLACKMPWQECIALGLGIDVALLMVTGQAMVMLNRWDPGAAIAGLLLASVLVAEPLLERSFNDRYEHTT